MLPLEDSLTPEIKARAVSVGVRWFEITTFAACLLKN